MNIKQIEFLKEMKKITDTEINNVRKEFERALKEGHFIVASDAFSRLYSLQLSYIGTDREIESLLAIKEAA